MSKSGDESDVVGSTTTTNTPNNSAERRKTLKTPGIMKGWVEKKKSILTLLSLATTLWLVANPVGAQGEICPLPTRSGQITLLEPPPVDARLGQLESNVGASLWLERCCEETLNSTYVSILMSDPDVQATFDGTDYFFDSGIAARRSLWSGELAAGNYTSHFIHADKVGRANQTFEFSAGFDSEIVAIVYQNRRGYVELLVTDETFGAPGTLYGGSDSSRMHELDGPNNWMRVSADRRTLSARMVVGRDIDNIRVITRCGPFDFGDAPPPYGDAWHVILPSGNPYIGDSPPDAETGTPPTDIRAWGDDLTGLDDEDQTQVWDPERDIETQPVPTLLCDDFITDTYTYNLVVPVSGGGFLNVWADWNFNGVFEETSDEHIVVDAQPVAGQVDAFIDIADDLFRAHGYARFRYSSQAGLGPNGPAPDGEVEDCHFFFTDGE